ncbi:MAG: hypothetical protein H6Q10_910 [Acidobacteria bacterium]|nr:hypothetical protein [Acidobacteriota bacterium]
MSFAPLAPALLVAGLIAAGVGLPALAPSRRPAAPVEPQVERPAAAAQVPEEELVVPAESVIGLQLEAAVNTPEAGMEGLVLARVTRDVMAGSRVAVPAGSRALGWALRAAPKGEKGQERARLEISFHALELPGGERVDIATEPVVRDARSQGLDTGRPDSGTAGGAVAGAILAGVRGGASDRASGLAGATVAPPDRADLPAGTVLNVRVKSGFRVRVPG